MNTDTNPTKDAVLTMGKIMVELLKKSNREQTANLLQGKLQVLENAPEVNAPLEDDIFAAVAGEAKAKITTVDPSRIEQSDSTSLFGTWKNKKETCSHTAPLDYGDHYKCPLCGEIAEGVLTDGEKVTRWEY